MIAKTIIDSDAFLEMPQSTQLLYFHFSLRGDDDGFINKPKAIMHMVGCKDDDLKILIAKKFIIPFESGVVVIKHWKIHNYIKNDRYNETKYKEERALLELDENKAYRLSDNMELKCIQSGTEMEPQVRVRLELGKDSIDNSGTSPPRKKFTPPTLEEVQVYCKERKNDIDAEKWHNYYTSNGWKVGKNPMKDWKAAVRTWEQYSKGQLPNKSKNSNFNNFESRYDKDPTYIEKVQAIVEKPRNNIISEDIDIEQSLKELRGNR